MNRTPSRRGHPGIGGTVVLDRAGLTAYAARDPFARALVTRALTRGGRVVGASTTLAEVLRGGPRDAPVHQVLKGIDIEPVTEQITRRAGELPGATGLDGHRCAIDSFVAVIARACQRPVIMLTSDLDGYRHVASHGVVRLL